MKVLKRDRRDTLLSAVAADDRGAFDRFFHLYYDQVFRFAYYHVGEKEACKEVVSEVFYSIWKSKKRLADIESIDAYLFASVRNEALRWLSKNRRDGQVPIEELIGNEPEDGDSPLELLESEELRDVLSQAIDSLPERCRIIFLLAREEGLKPKEIAEMLSIKESTVRVQMKLAVDRLIAYLRPIFPNMSFSWFLPFLF